jgi:hypothetical protein
MSSVEITTPKMHLNRDLANDANHKQSIHIIPADSARGLSTEKKFSSGKKDFIQHVRTDMQLFSTEHYTVKLQNTMQEKPDHTKE